MLDLFKLHKNSDKRFSLILAKPKNKKDIPSKLWKKTEKAKVNRFRKEYVPFYLIDWKNIEIDKLVVNNTCGRPINFIPYITEDFSKILGALCADGHITTKSKADYIIQLADYDKDAVYAYQRWIRNTFGTEYKVKKDYTSNCWRININNKIIGRYLVEVIGFPTGKKSDTIRVPRVIMQSNPEIQKEFITGVLTFDGAVNINGNIEFLTRSKQLYLGMIGILKKTGMNVRYKKVTDKNGFWRFHICRSNRTYGKWLHFFEKGTEKWEKVKENIEGFKKTPNSEEDVLMTFEKVFPSKNRNIVSFSNFYECIKNLGNCSIRDVAENLNIDKSTTNKYRKVLKDCNIISEKSVGGREYRIEIIFNKNINEWKIPERS